MWGERTMQEPSNSADMRRTRLLRLQADLVTARASVDACLQVVEADLARLGELAPATGQLDEVPVGVEH